MQGPRLKRGTRLLFFQLGSRIQSGEQNKLEWIMQLKQWRGSHKDLLWRLSAPLHAVLFIYKRKGNAWYWFGNGTTDWLAGWLAVKVNVQIYSNPPSLISFFSQWHPIAFKQQAAVRWFWEKLTQHAGRTSGSERSGRGSVLVVKLLCSACGH